MSFENFDTTLMLVGSDPPLTVVMYGRMREGASPVLNAVLKKRRTSERSNGIRRQNSAMLSLRRY